MIYILIALLMLSPPMITELPQLVVIDEAFVQDITKLTERIHQRVDNYVDRCIVGKILIEKRFKKRIKRVELINRYDRFAEGEFLFLEVTVKDGRIFQIYFHKFDDVRIVQVDEITTDIFSVGYVIGYHIRGLASAKIVRFLVTAN